jgi:hypothetical protein
VFQLSTVEAEDYAALFNSYAQALRGAYPAIQLGACSPTWREEQYPDWPAYVLNPYNLVDYGFAIPHLYVATQTGAATQHNYNVLFNDIIESKVGGKAGDLQLFRDVAFPNSVSLWPTEHNTMFGLFEYKGHAPVADNFKLKSALAVTSLQMKLVSEHAQGFNLFHACAVSHGNLANEPKTERTIVVDLVREPRSEGGVSIPASERRWVTPTFHAQSLLSHFGRGAAEATDGSFSSTQMPPKSAYRASTWARERSLSAVLLPIPSRLMPNPQWKPRTSRRPRTTSARPPRGTTCRWRPTTSSGHCPQHQ